MGHRDGREVSDRFHSPGTAILALKPRCMQNAIFSKNSQGSDGKTERPNSRQKNPTRKTATTAAYNLRCKCVNYHHVKKRKVPIKEKESKK